MIKFISKNFFKLYLFLYCIAQSTASIQLKIEFKYLYPLLKVIFLNEDNIAIRVGHHCAQPLLKTLGETATARMSFYIYNDESDIDKFCHSLDSIREYF